jgi:hypothetical protein
MTITNVALIVFMLAMIANAIALIRFWRMMRVMTIVLNNLIATQKQFDEIVKEEEQRRPKA